jgi:uncharacterized membrane protein YhaH (DUF805 family)
MSDLRYLFYLLAIAGAVVAAIFFFFDNGSDTEWGLMSLTISWFLYLICSFVPALTAGPRQTTQGPVSQ